MSFHVSFSLYERLCTWPPFENEAKGPSVEVAGTGTTVCGKLVWTNEMGEIGKKLHREKRH